MVRIITDSTSDVRPAEWAELGVSVLPLTVTINGKSYQDGIDLSNDTFFEMLEHAEQLPTTSQITPDTFSQAFEKHTGNGDDVVGVFISSELSGTCHSAEIAAQEMDPDKVFVVDSRIGTFGLAILVREAVKMRDAGMIAAEIAGALKKLVARIRLVAMVDTLKYLRLGGRISAATAFVGDLLKIRPMVEVKDGLIHNIGKIRGKRSVMQFISRYLDEHPIDTELSFAIGHSNAHHDCHNLLEFLKDRIPASKTFLAEIGAVIGTYIGPGAFGIAYFEKA